jgi:hypothetical protein
VTALGVLIDFRIRFGRHVTKICSRVHGNLQCSIKALQGSSSDTFFYCYIVFSSMSYLDCRRLQVASNN